MSVNLKLTPQPKRPEVSETQLANLIAIRDQLVGFDGSNLPSEIDRDGNHLLMALTHLTSDSARALTAVAQPVEDPESFLSDLEQKDPIAYHSMWFVCVGAHYVNRAVWQELGYPGRIPYPVAIDEPDPDLDGGRLLEPVKSRALLYRPTPN